MDLKIIISSYKFKQAKNLIKMLYKFIMKME